MSPVKSLLKLGDSVMPMPCVITPLDPSPASVKTVTVEMAECVFPSLLSLPKLFTEVGPIKRVLSVVVCNSRATIQENEREREKERGRGRGRGRESERETERCWFKESIWLETKMNVGSNYDSRSYKTYRNVCPLLFVRRSNVLFSHRWRHSLQTRLWNPG